MVYTLTFYTIIKLLINVVKKEQKGEGTFEWTFDV